MVFSDFLTITLFFQYTVYLCVSRESKNQRTKKNLEETENVKAAKVNKKKIPSEANEESNEGKARKGRQVLGKRGELRNFFTSGVGKL